MVVGYNVAGGIGDEPRAERHDFSAGLRNWNGCSQKRLGN
jgi:hypothetical protein